MAEKKSTDKESIEQLELLKINGNFTSAEEELISNIINNSKIPSYLEDRSRYQIYMRLKRKLKQSQKKVATLSNLFSLIGNLTVSNKLIGEDVD